MTERIPKAALIAALVVGIAILASLAYLSPGDFTSTSYLGGLLLIEILLASIWHYKQAFFALTSIIFLLAGVDLPIGLFWNSVRWLFLGVGALAGFGFILKERRYHLGAFHFVALVAVLAALISAAESRYAFVSSLKVLSIFLLFLFAATGARVTVTGREGRFFTGLLVGIEVLVLVLGASTFMGIEVLGNPNSRGAVAGVVCAPILLWATMLPQGRASYQRRLLLYGLAMYVTFVSQARASILAAFVACTLLCLALHQYRLLAQGLVIIAIMAATGAIVSPEAFSRTVFSMTSTVVFKERGAEKGVLASRKGPWQGAIDSIRQHPWFGTGFGTDDNGKDVTTDTGQYSTVSAVAAEHGSSYLAITSWVGIVGVVPFTVLVILLLYRIAKTVLWMWRTGNPSHPAVPLAMFVLAGLMHAFFEDWLFAPGYYLCFFYWSMAFVFVDQVRTLARPLQESVMLRPAPAMTQNLSTPAPVR